LKSRTTIHDRCRFENDFVGQYYRLLCIKHSVSCKLPRSLRTIIRRGWPPEKCRSDSRRNCTRRKNVRIFFYRLRINVMHRASRRGRQNAFSKRRRSIMYATCFYRRRTRRRGTSACRGPKNASTGMCLRVFRPHTSHLHNITIIIIIILLLFLRSWGIMDSPLPSLLPPTAGLKAFPV